MAKSSSYQAVIALGAKLDKTFGPTMKAAQKGMASVGNAVKISGKVAMVGTAAASAAAVKLSATVLKQFGELEQNLGGSEAVFGQYAKKIQQTGEDAYKNLGVSQSDYLATANKMGALFQGSGVEQQKSIELTEKAMQRAADMASVMGIDMQVALDSVAGAAKGNFTMMDNLGVAMNTTNIEAYALSKGLKFAWKSASQAEKAEVAMRMFLDNTQQYAGNFARESTQTITGSIGLWKASIGSFTAGLGNPNSDMKKLTGNIMDASRVVAINAIPVLKNMAHALPEALVSAFPKARPIVEKTTNFIRSAFNKTREKGASAISFIQEKWVKYGPVISKTVENFQGKAISAFNWVRDTGQTAIANIQSKFSEARPQVMDFIEVAKDVGTRLMGAFEVARPIIEWIFTDGLPKVISFGGNVLDVITNIYKFFSQNWSLISPFITGIAIAFGAYKTAMLISKGVTIATTVAQWALNAAMTANPIGLIILGIGALIGIGILLYKNWDVVKAKAFELWESIKSAFGGVAEWFGGIWEGVKGGFKAFVNFIITGLNKIPQAINSLKINIPDWVPGIGGKSLGFNLPTIPMFAKGVRNFQGGAAIVGERGAELLNLPRGTDVYSNRDTRSILSSPLDFGEIGDIILKVVNNIHGPITKEQAEEATEFSEAALEKMLARIKAKRRRKAFAG